MSDKLQDARGGRGGRREGEEAERKWRGGSKAPGEGREHDTRQEDEGVWLLERGAQ